MDQSNPLLNTTGLPRFDLIEAGHVVPAVRQVLADAEKILEEIESTLTPTWDGLIKPLEAMDIPFEYAWAPIGHLMGVKNSDELREAYEEAQGEVVVFGLRLKQSRPIYDGLVALKESDEWKNLTEVQQRIIDLKLRDAKHAGVGLDGEDRDRFNAIAQELSQIGTEFSNHVLDATKAFELVVTDKDHTEGWPTTLRQGSAQ